MFLHIITLNSNPGRDLYTDTELSSVLQYQAGYRIAYIRLSYYVYQAGILRISGYRIAYIRLSYSVYQAGILRISGGNIMQRPA